MSNIDKAAKYIRDGGLVAFPTETVYGLGADSYNQDACLRIFRAKGRPAINPLIVHVASQNQAADIAYLNDYAHKLIKAFWPGPLTLVLPLKNQNIAPAVVAGLDTIALRSPSHPVAGELILKSGCPVAAPSANPSGYISATKGEHVKEHFAGEDILVLEDNIGYIGIESTILDLTVPVPTILRSGFIDAHNLEQILQKPVGVKERDATVKSPGMLEKHYSPITRIRLNALSLKVGEVGLDFGDSKLGGDYNLSKSVDLLEAASNLYDMLRILDKYAINRNIKTIAIAAIPSIGIGYAINDRLRRASVL